MSNNILFQIISGKKILITGHTGFKGAWLSLWLNQNGAKLYGISKDIPTNPSLFEALNLEKKMEHIFLDIRDLASLKAEVKRIEPDFIFHMAAQPIVSLSYQDPIYTLSTNVMGTANILEAVRSLTNKCVVISVTSDKCYENTEWVWGYKETDILGGKDIYSGSKAAAEIIIHSYFHSFIREIPNIRLASVRAGNVIGGGDWAADRIVPDCIRSWSNGNAVEIRNPNATRPWQHVLEPLSGYIQLACELWNSDQFNGESFNFGPFAENNITVSSLIEKLSIKFGYTESDSAYFYNGEQTFSEAGLLNLNCEKAMFHLSWKPTLNIDELISFTGDWYWGDFQKDIDLPTFTENQILEYVKLANIRQVKWSE